MITIAPRTYVGVQTVFENLEKLGLSENILLEKVKLPIDDIVLFGAYSEDYKIIANNCREYGFLWTSSITEMELMGEWPFLQRAISMKPKFIWFGKDDVREYMSAAGLDEIKMFHLPYPLYSAEFSNPRKRRNVGLFCPHTLKKNIITNFAGWMISTKKVRSKLYTNTNISARNVVNIAWSAKEEYYDLISTFKLGLQVSISESFNYVAYDFLSRGIPILISPTIAENFEIEEEDIIIIKNIDSAKEIAKKIEEILKMDYDSYEDLSKRLYQHANKLRKKNNQILSDELWMKIS